MDKNLQKLVAMCPLTLVYHCNLYVYNIWQDVWLMTMSQYVDPLTEVLQLWLHGGGAGKCWPRTYNWQLEVSNNWLVTYFVTISKQPETWESKCRFAMRVCILKNMVESNNEIFNYFSSCTSLRVWILC